MKSFVAVLVIAALVLVCFAEEEQWSRSPYSRTPGRSPYSRTPGRTPGRVTPTPGIFSKCRVCIDAISAAENAVRRNSSVILVKSVIDRVCDRYKLRAWCQATIDRKLPLLLPVRVCCQTPRLRPSDLLFSSSRPGSAPTRFAPSPMSPFAPTYVRSHPLFYQSLIC